MRFSKMIALMAILGLAAQANAYSDGTLRRSVSQNQIQVAQADEGTVSEATPTQGVVIVNSNASTATTQQAVQQPATVVEATPVTESKAEALRKARQGEEVHTEQKIVEKLEESRLREEQQRAERLFGNRFDEAQQQQQQQPQVQQAAPVVAPVVSEPKAEKATQVTIEKVEIVQPAAAKEDKDDSAAKQDAAITAPVAESKLDMPKLDEKPAAQKFVIGAILAAPQYSADNVKSNYGLGFSIGTIVDEHFGLEGSFLYSNYYIDTFWKYGLYNELDQYDVQAAAKYYVLTGRLKPYVGASATYITRKYQDRIKNGVYWMYNSATSSEQTQAVDVGLLAGAEFAINDNLMIGGGVDYNHNIMNNRNNFVSVYNLQPDDTKALEEIDYYTVKINAKLTF